MKLHLRLRDLREDRDMSQAAMAKLLKCSQQTYSRYESHTTEIPLESLIFLAEYYDTSTDYLLGITDQIKPFLSLSCMRISLQSVRKSRKNQHMKNGWFLSTLL